VTGRSRLVEIPELGKGRGSLRGRAIDVAAVLDRLRRQTGQHVARAIEPRAIGGEHGEIARLELFTDDAVEQRIGRASGIGDLEPVPEQPRAARTSARAAK